MWGSCNAAHHEADLCNAQPEGRYESSPPTRIAGSFVIGNDKKIYSRLQQLDKRRVEDDKKLIKDLNENRFPQKNKIITKLDKQWAEYQRRRIKKAPNIASICQKLDKLAVLDTPNNDMSWANVIYPEFYRKYSRAIHSDLGLIRKFVINRKNKILWYEDIEDDPKDIIEYTLTVFADINKLFLNYYK